MLKRLTLLAAGLVLGFEGFYGFQIWQLRDNNPRITAFMAERLKELRALNPDAELKQNWVTYEAISPAVKRAIVASEDAKFAWHDGFDWDGIQRALEKNLAEGEIVAGGSTISQQLAKNLYLSGERSIMRKGQEAVMTLMLEMFLGKRRILEIYLNIIEWGEGVFGIDAAARYYFGMDASRLSARQAALLAAIVPRPRHYDRNGWGHRVEQRALTILKRMQSSRVP